MTARFTLCLLIVLSGLTANARAQDVVEGSGIISGKVTLDGKPGAGILLILSKTHVNRGPEQKLMQGSVGMRSATDSRGHYQFAKVADGSYVIRPFAPSLTIGDKSRVMDSISLTDGEEVDGIDFDLKSGAVITGAVTDHDGRPLIGLSVNAAPDDNVADQSKNTASFGSARTDDRGIYRIFGLSAGRYQVEAGIGGPIYLAGGLPAGGPASYHDPSDPSKPGSVNVTAGSETAGIDIRFGPPPVTFEAMGRVVDESGRSIPNINVLCKGCGDQGSSSGPGPFGPQTNTMGEFKLRGLKPGSYTVAPFMLLAAENEYYGDSITFEVKNANVSGLEIKLHKGMTASGQVVLEGADDPPSVAKLHEQQVVGASEGGASEGFNMSKSTIGPEGEFALHGLAPGKLQLAFGDIFGQSLFQISRVELNGTPQREGIQVEPGQDLSGLKLVVAYANCSIHGRVTVTGGKLSKGTSLIVSVVRSTSDPNAPGDFVEGRRMSRGTAYVEPNGNFKVEGLVPGDYLVTVQTQSGVNGDGSSTNASKYTSQVTLASGQDAELALTIDVAAAAPSDK